MFFSKSETLHTTPGERHFQIDISAEDVRLAHHRVNGNYVLPGAACLDLALTFSKVAFPSTEFNLSDCLWLKPIVCVDGRVSLSINLVALPSHIVYEISVSGQVCAMGNLIRRVNMPMPWGLKTHERLKTIRVIGHSDVYKAFSAMGIDYGSHFALIKEVRVQDNFAKAVLRARDVTMTSLLDGAFQSGLAISIGQETNALMPFSLGQLCIYKEIDFAAAQNFIVITHKASPFRTSIVIFDEERTPLISVCDLGVKTTNLAMRKSPSI